MGKKYKRFDESRILTNELIAEIAIEKNMDYVFCKECGKVINESTKMILSKDGTKFIDYTNTATFLKIQNYNGKDYRLCRCKECVAKQFPYILESKILYAQKWSFVCKYAFDVADEDFDDLMKKRQSITKEKMIERWGEEIGTEKWNSYCNKQAETNTFEYKNKKYGMTKEEFYYYNKSRAVTLENLINKHGQEEGTRIYNEYVEKQRYTVSLEYFIEMYGEEEGKKKFYEFDEKRINAGPHGMGYSLISKELFDRLKECKTFKNHELFYADSEYRLTIPGHTYHLDFYDSTLNLVIEFQGYFYHMNKEEHDISRMKLIQENLNNCAIFVNELSYMKDKYKVINQICDYVSNIPNMSDEQKNEIFII